MTEIKKKCKVSVFSKYMYVVVQTALGTLMDFFLHCRNRIIFAFTCGFLLVCNCFILLETVLSCFRAAIS